MISFFVIPYSFSTLFIKTSLSWLIFELIKTLEIKTSMLFHLHCASNTTSLCLFFFFLIIDFYFLIPEMIAKIYHSVANLVTHTGMSSKEANAAIEIDLVTAEAKI